MFSKKNELGKVENKTTLTSATAFDIKNPAVCTENNSCTSI
jgi:hypothetical protein